MFIQLFFLTFVTVLSQFATQSAWALTLIASSTVLAWLHFLRLIHVWKASKRCLMMYSSEFKSTFLVILLSF